MCWLTQSIPIITLSFFSPGLSSPMRGDIGWLFVIQMSLTNGLHVLLLCSRHCDINGFVQDCSNSSALAIELLQSCTNPPICYKRWFSQEIWLYLCEILKHSKNAGWVRMMVPNDNHWPICYKFGQLLIEAVSVEQIVHCYKVTPLLMQWSCCSFAKIHPYFWPVRYHCGSSTKIVIICTEGQ